MAKSAEYIHSIKARLRRHALHTVCEEARCPNLSECFSRWTATFMILGDTCTRSCRFCNIKNADEDDLKPPSKNEPAEIAQMVSELGLKHVVITSVTRDDLSDEGSGQFAATISALLNPPATPPHYRRTSTARRAQRLRGDDRVTIEVLTPDFHARPDCLKTVCKAGPDIFNHNIETIRRLTNSVRSHADYDRSLAVLKWVKNHYPNITVKSGLMVGLGETEREVLETLSDLCHAGSQIVTIGQYLRPNKNCLAVTEYVSQGLFEKYKAKGEELGLNYVFSGHFVRSSYMADEGLRRCYGQ